MRSPRARSTGPRSRLRQFKSAFIYLLLVAAAIVFVVGEYFDAGIILGFVLVNAALGFYQEYKSEQALRALQQYITLKSRVKRDSRWHTIDSKNLVPGDIIRLEPEMPCRLTSGSSTHRT